MDSAQDRPNALSFLKSLINKTLRIHTTDSRMFIGTFKCTDPVCYYACPCRYRLDYLLTVNSYTVKRTATSSCP